MGGAGWGIGAGDKRDITFRRGEFGYAAVPMAVCKRVRSSNGEFCRGELCGLLDDGGRGNIFDKDVELLGLDTSGWPSCDKEASEDELVRRAPAV
jgi:hypothetical protein